MDKKLKAKWVKALRSGEYQQCRMRMFDGSAYCCLGVLERVCGTPDKDMKGRPVTYLAKKGLRGISKQERRRLSELNDFDELTFPKIAAYIEANL